MTSWNKLSGTKERNQQSGGLFFKLANDGEREVIAFVGDPHMREVYWSGKGYVDANDETAKEAYAEGKRPTNRIAINVYIPSKRSMKVLEAGIAFFSDVLTCREKYGLEKTLFEIKRNGAAGDPKTTYSLLPEGPISESLANEIARARKIDLEALFGPEAAEAENDNARPVAVAPIARPLPPYKPRTPGSEPVIDLALANSIALRLKALPRESIEQFLKTFSVQRVRDLHASQQQAALNLVASLEHPEREPGSDDDVDPFEGT